jgi:alkylation response protein AidB-like acyl-CoA dehydrogenase
MDFTLSPAQPAVQDQARRLAREVEAQAAPLDREGRFPWEILRLWAGEGLFGTALPAEYGGSGLDYVAYALAQMELAQACPSSCLVLHVNHTLFGGALNQFGTPAQKQRFLPPVASGEAIASFALTDPEAGSDPGALQTTARREGDGWVLTGRKNFVTSGGVARYALVAALTDPAQGPKGISAFVVDLEATAGITPGPPRREAGDAGRPVGVPYLRGSPASWKTTPWPGTSGTPRPARFTKAPTKSCSSSSPKNC